jgi:hypothetical protein
MKFDIYQAETARIASYKSVVLHAVLHYQRGMKSLVYVTVLCIILALV